MIGVTRAKLQVLCGHRVADSTGVRVGHLGGECLGKISKCKVPDSTSFATERTLGEMKPRPGCRSPERGSRHLPHCTARGL